jgi:tRNA pseudouridine55 synthase
MQPRAQRRDLHGILLLDKPPGITSNGALQRVKRLCNARKAGHTGSLDPLATGMLPICFGEATKMTGFMLDADKAYRVTAYFGTATDSGDADGTVTVTSSQPPPPEQVLLDALARFVGKSEQTPPMYSALKHEGQRLYTLARRGIEVDRPRRAIEIYSAQLCRYEFPEVELEVRCSKGTYIRTLVEDLAKSLDTVAHVTALRRLFVEPFSASAMLSLDSIQALIDSDPDAIGTKLLPVDSALVDWPRLTVAPEDAQKLAQGQAVPAAPDWPESRVRLYSPGERFFGIGEIQSHRRLVPKRIFPALGPWS